MQFSDQQLAEFRQLCEKECGMLLTEVEALDAMSRLIGFFQLVVAQREMS